MKRWRDMLLIVVLFGILIGFTIYGPGSNQADDDGQPGSTYSAGDQGTLGLQRWLQALNYNAVRFEASDWTLPSTADALFMLAPEAEPITLEEAEATLRWVRDGGTLVLVVPTPPFDPDDNHLLRQLQAEIVLNANDDLIERADAAQPLLTVPPVTSVRINADSAIELGRNDYVPLLTSTRGPALVGVQEGRGYVYVASALFPFTNEGIQEAGSAALILNLMARVPAGATVLFDEYHHGYAATAASVPRAALTQWWGWLILYAVLVIALYIVLTGRRFGRAVPLRLDVARRSSVEYVQSLAMLFRRAGKQSYVMDHYHQQLKRRLARPYGFAPPGDDALFVRELQRYGGATDEQADRLRDLLARLRGTANEQQLVALIHAADHFADQKGRIR